MQIAYLTAGAAGMFCGSCMHDNALAKALIKQGVDCTLLPIYTPIRTDEEDVSADRVFFGGVNIFLQQKMPWLKYLPSWVDSALNRPSLIRRATEGQSKTDPRFLGKLTVSMLRGLNGNQAKEVRRMRDWLESDLKPDAFVLSNMLIAGSIPEIKRRLNKPVYVTLQGDDIFFDFLPEPYREQALHEMRQIVPLVDRFIVNSHFYQERMTRDLNIPSEKFVILPLGIELADFRQLDSPQHPTVPTIGYLARMTKEKGLHVLVDAFIRTSKLPEMRDARLLLAGWMGKEHEPFWGEQQEKIRQAGLQDRVNYLGTVDRKTKIDFLRSIDVLCVPTTYQEPKGLFALEGVAAGVPYLLPAHGAFPELHSRLSFGATFTANDPSDLDRQLQAMLSSAGKPGSATWERRNQLLAEIDIATMAERLLRLLSPNR
jgi:glycosyltransferase involved in cell wall biosynthesis